MRRLLTLSLSVAFLFGGMAACSDDPETIIVTETEIVEVPVVVPGETVIVEVPGETIVEIVEVPTEVISALRADPAPGCLRHR